MGIELYQVSDNETNPERTHTDYCPWQSFWRQNLNIMEPCGPWTPQDFAVMKRYIAAGP